MKRSPHAREVKPTVNNGIRRAVITSLILILSGGCGDGRPQLVPVSGRVLIDGQPVECGNIRFTPKDYRAASGKLGAGGRFELTTYEAGDGCIPGKHAVTVNAREIISPDSIRWHAPKKYCDLQTADLEIEIEEPTDSVEIELTWAGGKPFVETVDSTGD